MMTPITDIHSVSEAIRDAVAPVFLLTGIGSILGVLIGRLGRSIDSCLLYTSMHQAINAIDANMLTKRTHITM